MRTSPRPRGGQARGSWRPRAAATSPPLLRHDIRVLVSAETVDEIGR